MKQVFYIAGRQSGRTYAEAQILKAYWPQKCLIFNYKQMDALVAYGVKPSQLHLEGELHNSEYKVIRQNLLDEADMSKIDEYYLTAHSKYDRYR